MKKSKFYYFINSLYFLAFVMLIISFTVPSLAALIFVSFLLLTMASILKKRKILPLYRCFVTFSGTCP